MLDLTNSNPPDLDMGRTCLVMTEQCIHLMKLIASTLRSAAIKVSKEAAQFDTSFVRSQFASF